MDRLELQHIIWIEILGGRYHLAPLEQSHLTHALDVGTGTGSELRTLGSWFHYTETRPQLILRIRLGN